MIYTPMWHDVWKHLTYEIVVFVLLLWSGGPEDIWKNLLFGALGYIVFYQFVEPIVRSMIYENNAKK